MDSDISTPLRLLFVISNLSYAGAQRQLLTLATHLDRNKIAVEVCTLSHSGEMEPEFHKIGIPLWRVTKNFRYDPGIFLRFARLCRRQRIQILYSYLDFDNLVARIGGRLAGIPVIISSERSLNYTLPGMKKHLDRWTIPLSDLIIANSFAGEQFLIRTKKIPPKRVRVIRNSLDLDVLKSRRAPGEVRRQFSIPSEALVVGMAARLRPEKNFEMFFQAAEKITCQYPNTWFLQIGDATPKSVEYGKWVEWRREQLTHPERVILGGYYQDMGAWYHDIDILIITSNREGLSNVLMEAMSMGLPAVVTEVGDNRDLLGDNGGYISPTGDYQNMVEGLSRLLDDNGLRRSFGEHNQMRAKELFSVQRMVLETETVIQELYRLKAKTARI